jgi:hypothetical protein
VFSHCTVLHSGSSVPVHGLFFFLSGQDGLMSMIKVVKEGTAQWEVLMSAGLHD